jgi:tetratricopeptide (TPR) repeat protein
VALDPHFALAHARLAITLGLLYRFRGASEEVKAAAHCEIEEALRLQPKLGEAHLAHGLYHYRVGRDFNRALSELERARRLLPNDTEADMTVGFIRRRQGRWREARSIQESVLPRDPLNSEFEHELHATACLLRDWPAAATHAARAVALSPKVEPLKAERALVDFWRAGDLAALQRFWATIRGYGDLQGNLTWERWDGAMLSRDLLAARLTLDMFPFETLPSVLGAPIPKSYLVGCISLAQRDQLKAAEMFENARPAMEAETAAHPGNALRHARLGLLYAYMGRKADALREGEKAVRLTPVAEDAIDGHQWLCNLALIHARLGDNDEAISMIERLLREPGCVSPLNEACLSLWDLRLRWQWDPLRKDQRFQKILAAPEPATLF